jgi:FMN phosphatase YigB (HAD superfamily)
MLKEMGFENLFDKVFSSAYIGSKKPETNFFEYIYQKIHAHSIKKEEIMFWDDEPKHVKAAINFGFKGHVYKNFQDFKEQLSNREGAE